MILLGHIAGAHGIRGEVTIITHTGEPADIGSYGALADKSGRSYTVTVVRVTPKGVISRVAGVADRTAAEALKGVELFVARERLPPVEDNEFYYTDLVGLTAVNPDGAIVGRVSAVQNFGAGDLLEIALAGSRNTEFIPFTSAFVPEIRMNERQLVVRLPDSGDGAESTSGN